MVSSRNHDASSDAVKFATAGMSHPDKALIVQVWETCRSWILGLSHGSLQCRGSSSETILQEKYEHHVLALALKGFPVFAHITLSVRWRNCSLLMPSYKQGCYGQSMETPVRPTGRTSHRNAKIKVYWCAFQAVRELVKAGATARRDAPFPKYQYLKAKPTRLHLCGAG